MLIATIKCSRHGSVHESQLEAIDTGGIFKKPLLAREDSNGQLRRKMGLSYGNGL